MGQFNSKLNMKLRKMESKYELFIKAYDNKKLFITLVGRRKTPKTFRKKKSISSKFKSCFFPSVSVKSLPDMP